MRWLIGLALVVGLAACDTKPDPLAQNRRVCADAHADAAARKAACSALIDSGTLHDAARAAAHVNRAAADRESGDVTAALRDFDAALDLDRENAVALEGRAVILIASGQLDAAEPMLDRLDTLHQVPARVHLLRGDIAAQRSDYPAASAEYDAALAADDRLALAFAGRARAKQALHDLPGALADYDSAINIDGNLAAARAGRCWARLARDADDVGPPRSDADAAVRADARNLEGQLCRGVLQLRAGEWADAKTTFEAALTIAPGNPTALFGRGIARRRSGDSEGTKDMNQARDFDHHIGEAFDNYKVRTY